MRSTGQRYKLAKHANLKAAMVRSRGDDDLAEHLDDLAAEMRELIEERQADARDMKTRAADNDRDWRALYKLAKKFQGLADPMFGQESAVFDELMMLIALHVSFPEGGPRAVQVGDPLPDGTRVPSKPAR